MSLRKARFIHFQTRHGKGNSRGFTVYLYPTEDSIVTVGLSICHKDDHFCKATGRAKAIDKADQTIRVVDLPLFLAQLEARVEGYRIHKNDQRFYANEWAWIWKYFL